MRARTTEPVARGCAWRRLGWLTLLAFTLKGIVTGSLIVWALLKAVG